MLHIAQIVDEIPDYIRDQDAEYPALPFSGQLVPGKITEKQVGGQQEKARNGDLSQSHRHEIFDPVRKTPYPILRPAGKQIHIIRVDPDHKDTE